MTTNITPIEALEKIKEALENISIPSRDPQDGVIIIDDRDYDKLIEQIDQALANNNEENLRSQECDVTRDLMEENKRLRGLLGKPYKKRIDLENIKLNEENKKIKIIHSKLLEEYNSISSAYLELKQLHSQEKTFTLDEIKERLSTLIEDDYLDDLLAEFEKAVG